MIKGVGGREGVIGVWDTGDAGEEGLGEVGMAGDVRSGWQLVVCLEAVHE